MEVVSKGKLGLVCSRAGARSVRTSALTLSVSRSHGKVLGRRR